MTELKMALAAAAENGLVSADHVNDLEAFLGARCPGGADKGRSTRP
ncbi:hypothetical protein [Sinorhizobium medicae]|nr:hypothetical protein [Sinorhizobium medicae]